MRSFLDFEQPIAELESKIEELRHLPGAADINIADEVAKLPLEFKTLGFGVHRAFDTLAADAASRGDPRHTLGQLASTLEKCVACHDGYEFKVSAGR